MIYLQFSLCLRNTLIFLFESQNDLFDTSEIFEKMLTLSSAPYSMKAENDYVEKGIALAYAMFSNYDELGDKARKSAVSHFIEEMHKRKKHCRK